MDVFFFFFSISVYFHWKSAFWVRPCLKKSLWRHTLTDFHDFGINGKKRPYPILWYQTIILWARQFQVHRGVVNHVTKKGLVGLGLVPYFNILVSYHAPWFDHYSFINCLASDLCSAPFIRTKFERRYIYFWPNKLILLLPLWNYDTENHTENFCDTEMTQKSRWKIFAKEITVKIQDYLTKIFSFVVQGHWNHTKKV